MQIFLPVLFILHDIFCTVFVKYNSLKTIFWCLKLSAKIKTIFGLFHVWALFHDKVLSEIVLVDWLCILHYVLIIINNNY